MFYVIQKVFSPNGQQIDSDSIAEFATERDANEMADRLTIGQENCPPNADEDRCEWYVLAD